ncbi:hypothetical protein R9C00_03070 [Flammeovirgaceae bacterium SG7u.111]|nr:hypothetical protein [Flammeovirgaceae bacterium SG7u.132]WPO36423.1 hypothetical protein R9C00_03070 [Flammeovirgaceae bacterium SG7u.111]
MLVLLIIALIPSIFGIKLLSKKKVYINIDDEGIEFCDEDIFIPWEMVMRVCIKWKSSGKSEICYLVIKILGRAEEYKYHLYSTDLSESKLITYIEAFREKYKNQSEKK